MGNGVKEEETKVDAPAAVSAPTVEEWENAISQLPSKAVEMLEEVVGRIEAREADEKRKLSPNEQWDEVKRKLEEWQSPLVGEARTTKRMLNAVANHLEKVAKFTRDEIGHLTPLDVELMDYVAPYNQLVDEELTIGDTDNIRPFQNKVYQLVIGLAEGDWMQYCGQPIANGMGIFMATPPLKKNPTAVDLVREAFRDSYYADGKANAEDIGVWYKLLRRAYRFKMGPISHQEAGKHLVDRGSLNDCYVTQLNRFRVDRVCKEVGFYRLTTPEKVFFIQLISKLDHPHRRWDIFMNTVRASEVYDIAAETRAMEKLRKTVTEKQYNQYVITGVIELESKRSGLTYYVRRLRPTIVARRTHKPNKVLDTFIASLCMHPEAYYLNSFAGCQSPTDDVVNHVNHILGDEHYFWRKSNPHTLYQMEAGLP